MSQAFFEELIHVFRLLNQEHAMAGQQLILLTSLSHLTHAIYTYFYIVIDNYWQLFSPHGNVMTTAPSLIGGDRRLNRDATTKTTPTNVVQTAARTMNCIVERRRPRQQPFFGWEWKVDDLASKATATNPY
jgi:hypothetical protein